MIISNFAALLIVMLLANLGVHRLLKVLGLFDGSLEALMQELEIGPM